MTDAIRKILDRYYGQPVVDWAISQGVTVHTLGHMEKYKEASPALRRLGVDVDAWPVPPAGLFIVEEKTVYLQKVNDMIVAHEFAHALDCLLGKGIYRSDFDKDIRRAFASARRFVTPYAASALDEYFAECMRAYVGANSDDCGWPPVSRIKLLRIDPAMHDIIRDIFTEIETEAALVAA